MDYESARMYMDRAHLGPLIAADGTVGNAELSVDDSPVITVGPLKVGCYTLKWKAVGSATDLLYAQQGPSTIGASHATGRGEELEDGDIVTFNVTKTDNAYVALVCPSGDSGTVRLNMKSAVSL